jgi:hypothetical protein
MSYTPLIVTMMSAVEVV